MKIVKQEVQVVKQVPSSYQETVKHIEEVGRICYQSGDKATPSSAELFCAKLFNSGHMAMIEHSWLVIKVSKIDLGDQITIDAVFDSPFIKTMRIGNDVYISGNWRAFIEAQGKSADFEFFRNLPDNVANMIRMMGLEAEVLEDLNIPKSMRAYTAIMKTDRAVTHELVRHRPASYAQESQRYVAYRDEVEFILPYMFDKREFSDPENAILKEMWQKGIETVASLYRRLLVRGMSPQEARVILPNCTSTQIAVTADVEEWNHIFALRTARDAYPQIRRLMLDVQDRMKKETAK